MLDGVRDPQEELNRLGRTGGKIVVKHSPGAVVVTGDGAAGAASTTSPPKPPKENSVDHVANLVGIGGLIGAGGAALFVLGQDQGWPFDTFGAGIGIGTVAGTGLGLLVALMRRRSHWPTERHWAERLAPSALDEAATRSTGALSPTSHPRQEGIGRDPAVPTVRGGTAATP